MMTQETIDEISVGADKSIAGLKLLLEGQEAIAKAVEGSGLPLDKVNKGIESSPELLGKNEQVREMYQKLGLQ